MDINGALSRLISQDECLLVVRNTLKLAKTEKIPLLRYEIKRGSNDLVGFMGEYYKLNVWLEDKTSSTGELVMNYFLKSLPISNELHRDECLRKGFFNKEARVYTDILPNLQRYATSKLFPTCFYARPDLIVLEDLLSPTTGYMQLNSNYVYTRAHHEVVLKHLAKIHAASMAWEREEHINIGVQFKDVLIELQLNTSNEWYDTSARGIIFLARMHPKFQNPKAQDFIKSNLYKILCNVEALTEPSTELKNVFVHRDIWDRNIFFKNDASGNPVECCVCDFQLTRYSPPALDVLFFIYTTTTLEERAKSYEVYLDIYYNALKEFMRDLKLPENLITRRDFQKDCRRARVAALVLQAVGVPLMNMPKGLVNKMRNEEKETFDGYMNKKRDEMFVRIMAIDEGYKDLVMRTIEELLDYVLENGDHL